MHARFVRSAAVAVMVTGTLAWAPAASAQPSEPAPSASAAPGETPARDAGSVEITAKDTAGDALPGAVFLLLDSAGQEAGRGKTDAQGKLTFPDLAPGVYRLKETASGSTLHDTVDDQDVIVTPGTETPLTIVVPFKAASVLLKAKDDKTGKMLAGATVNIGTDGKTILTLTTGSDGTASGKLPINSRTGSDFWVKQVQAPAGYDIYKPSKAFKAKPGDPVTLTVTNAKTATTPPPTEKPTDKPTEKPSGKPSPAKPGKDEDVPAPSASGTPTSDETASSTAAPAPAGSLAHTGADATPWLIGGAGVLIAAGGGTLVAARRRRSDNSTDDGSTAS
ncbi:MULTISPECIES: SpaA isopeptide-forming pilin-related protein [Streptomyces]|uniref:SpaA isopeptide-forming pilin-related protein n=1 Tax=Streptomyces TaxID=1883 RepID=UPI0004E70DAD|nr:MULTISPECIES: SpaA isopeptide-forming pilin-related protein [Streptomyces]MBP5909106.1 LPXTG cell wall anchor domain-containing protein [Streptomyces sp. LBUM 1478]MBP5928041.1 LPXTG cell wall anchor domain-containing protein [Streptomyces sp. LBUM 1479]KFG10119.1 ligand-binding membrane protein [Streptomyces scabiei]MDW8476408.1 SpaA isopeptide-forming pilin-related protein [Streptomyces scabiei]MDX2551634.1 SpaA isopeptide-forming pilin-related protein [Streptomyces stelliscabiei]